MKTNILKINEKDPEIEKIAFAAQVLRDGGVVAFPTETVYGLGANTFNQAAVHKIFCAKGRPSDNPLIVHVAKLSDMDKLVKDMPKQAEKLIQVFWPGPLTIIMKKTDAVPDVVTAGLDTVAIRMPSHSIAHKLIEVSGVPVAAPSANLSGKPSPTVAQHVIDDLYGRVDVIIDGGCSQVGLESTVIDVTTGKPLLLRPGGVTYEQLKAVLGDVEIDRGVLEKVHQNTIPRSPGMKYKHYSPNAQVIVVKGEKSKVVERINQLVSINKGRGLKVGVLATDDTVDYYNADYVLSAGDDKHPETIAASLFNRLREFDTLGIDIVFTESVTENGIGMAILNRLHKAAGYHIIYV